MTINNDDLNGIPEDPENGNGAAGGTGTQNTQPENKIIDMNSLAIEQVEFGEENQAASRASKELPPNVTSKHLYKDILRITWPSLVEMTLTQLASLVDQLMVASSAGGMNAVASVGLATMPRFILMSVFMSFSVGSMALVARYKGMGEQKKANLVLRQSVLLAAVTSALLIAAGLMSSQWMVDFMANSGSGAIDAATISDANAYLRVQIWGLPTLAITSMITASLRGVGNTRIAMVYNIISNLVNIFFNYCFIYGNFGFPEWGVLGASVATVIGQLAAAIMAVITVMSGKQYLTLRIRDGFMPHAETLKSIFRIGFPALIEQMVMRIGNTLYNRTIATLGVIDLATHNIALSIQSMSFTLGMAISSPATSLIGQSLGKRRSDMAQAYSYRCKRIGVVLSLALSVIFFFFGGSIVGIFSDDPQVVEKGAFLLKICSFILPFQSQQFITAGILRGAGDTKSTAVIVAGTTLLLRPALASWFINTVQTGLAGAWYAFAIDQLVRTLLVTLRFNSGKWKTAFQSSNLRNPEL